MTSFVLQIGSQILRPLVLLSVILSVPAVAQQFPGTRSVNDCTFFQDSDQVRRCIEAYQGAPTTPGMGTLPQPAPPPLLAPPPAPTPQTLAPAPPRVAPR